jgi:hypothetical protein
MNATTSSVLPLTAIALCLTPKQWLDWFGIVDALAILEAQRIARCRREVLLNAELKP